MNAASKSYVNELRIYHLNLRSIRRLGAAWGEIYQALRIAVGETFRRIIKHSHLGREHLDIMARRLIATYARHDYRTVVIEYPRIDDEGALHCILFIARDGERVRWVQHVLPMTGHMLRAAAYSDPDALVRGFDLRSGPTNAITTTSGETSADEKASLVEIAVACANGDGSYVDLIEVLGTMSDAQWSRFERDLMRRGSFIQ